MQLHLTLSQLTLLVGTALAVALMLGALFYFLHRATRRQGSGGGFHAKPPRAENEPAFVAATVQGVIADLKAGQKDLEARLRSAEAQARTAQRTLEALAREIPDGLIIIGRDGCVARANAQARELLAADLWSRRPFKEIVGRESPLAAMVEECLESGRPMKKVLDLGPVVRAGAAHVEVSVLAIEGGPSTVVEGVICLLRKLPVPHDS